MPQWAALRRINFPSYISITSGKMSREPGVSNQIFQIRVLLIPEKVGILRVTAGHMRVTGISPPVINDPKNFSHPIAKTDKKVPNVKKEDSKFVHPFCVRNS